MSDDPQLSQLIKQKADQEDLLKLMEHKTNKVDSEQQMRFLDAVYRMLSQLAVQVMELSSLMVV